MEWFIADRPDRSDWSGPVRSPRPTEVEWTRWSAESVDLLGDDPPRRHPVLLGRAPGGHAFMVDAARARVLPESPSFREVQSLASAAAAVWWNEEDQRKRSKERLHGLVAFAEALESLRGDREVFEALVRDGGRIVGAAGGSVIERVEDSSAALIAFPSQLGSVGSTSWSPLLERAGVRRAQDLGGDAGPGDALGTIAKVLHADVVVHHPIRPGLAVVFAERRRGRVFDAEDWAALEGVARLTRMALRRG